MSREMLQRRLPSSIEVSTSTVPPCNNIYYFTITRQHKNDKNPRPASLTLRGYGYGMAHSDVRGLPLGFRKRG
jgi:hypothetical protein